MTPPPQSEEHLPAPRLPRTPRSLRVLHALRGLCARVCSDKTLERVIDPALSDLQLEYANARARGAVWRGRFILLAGFVTLCKIVLVCGCERALGTRCEWTLDDDRAFARTIGVSLVSVIAIALLFALPPLRTLPVRLAIYAVPQAVPFAIPLGVTLGVFCGLGTRGGCVISRRFRSAVLALALVGAMMSFTMMVWVAPAAAGQAYRAAGGRGPTNRPIEMTMGQLRARIAEFDRAGWSRAGQTFRVAYQLRWSLPSATIVLALFAVSVMPRRPASVSASAAASASALTSGSRMAWARPWLLALAGCGVGVAYFLLLEFTVTAAQQRALEPFAAAWLPNLVFVMASIASIARNVPSRIRESLE